MSLFRTIVLTFSLLFLYCIPRFAHALTPADVKWYDPVTDRQYAVDSSDLLAGRVYSYWNDRLKKRVWGIADSGGEFCFALGQRTTLQSSRFGISDQLDALLAWERLLQTIRAMKFGMFDAPIDPAQAIENLKATPIGFNEKKALNDLESQLTGWVVLLNSIDDLNSSRIGATPDALNASPAVAALAQWNMQVATIRALPPGMYRMRPPRPSGTDHLPSLHVIEAAIPKLKKAVSIIPTVIRIGGLKELLTSWSEVANQAADGHPAPVQYGMHANPAAQLNLLIHLLGPLKREALAVAEDAGTLESAVRSYLNRYKELQFVRFRLNESESWEPAQLNSARTLINADSGERWEWHSGRYIPVHSSGHVH